MKVLKGPNRPCQVRRLADKPKQTVDGQSDGLKTSRKNNKKNDEETLMKVKPTFYWTKQKIFFFWKKNQNGEKIFHFSLGDWHTASCVSSSTTKTILSSLNYNWKENNNFMFEWYTYIVSIIILSLYISISPFLLLLQIRFVVTSAHPFYGRQIIWLNFSGCRQLFIDDKWRTSKQLFNNEVKYIFNKEKNWKMFSWKNPLT